MLTALRHVSPDMVVWVPSHQSEHYVGAKYLSDGTVLTERDRFGNSQADTLAKFAVEEHRVDQQIRFRVASIERHAEQVAVAVTRITAVVLTRTAAEGGPDSVASRRAAGNADRRLIGSTKPILGDLTIELGGHELQQVGTVWRCVQCWRWSRSKSKLARQRCHGAVQTGWFEWAAQPAGSALAIREHFKIRSGPVEWCAVCGAYAQSYARTLAQSCPGPPGPGHMGRRDQLRCLLAGRHPKTGFRHYSLEPPVPDVSNHRIADMVHQAFSRRRLRKELPVFELGKSGRMTKIAKTSHDTGASSSNLPLHLSLIHISEPTRPY